jgi:hypothetical protein
LFRVQFRYCSHANILSYKGRAVGDGNRNKRLDFVSFDTIFEVFAHRFITLSHSIFRKIIKKFLQ